MVHKTDEQILLIYYGPHHYAQRSIRPIVTVLAWSVFLLVTSASPAKMAEPIKLPFGVRTRMGTRNHMLGKWTLLRVILGYDKTCQQSTYSSLSATGQMWCGPWLPAYCSNFFTTQYNIYCRIWQTIIVTTRASVQTGITPEHRITIVKVSVSNQQSILKAAAEILNVQGQRWFNDKTNDKVLKLTQTRDNLSAMKTNCLADLLLHWLLHIFNHRNEYNYN